MFDPKGSLTRLRLKEREWRRYSKSRELPFGPQNSQEFDVCLSDNPNPGSPQENTGGRGPKLEFVFVMQCFILGQLLHGNIVLTTLTALNVVVHMEPTMKYPFNIRSFFTDQEMKDISSGLVIWCGYFQSVRPTIRQLLVNVNISTGIMYKAGNLMDLCLMFLGCLNNLCIEVGSSALIPLELCMVPPGQIMWKQLPLEKTKDVVEFATNIITGLFVLQYSQLEYVCQFGMHVEDITGSLTVTACIFQPPTLKYGVGSTQPTITPTNGAWNMIDKWFFRAASIDRWIVVVYERQQRFNPQAAQDMIDGMLKSFRDVGIHITDGNVNKPMVTWQDGQGRIGDHPQLIPHFGHPISGTS
ncbi:hypothetical protein F4604DRAFT_1690775 [Suillus subluteus]|nr:hypothetical protein F4604DRAFT_1690775 [Suillus subluteus]